MKRWIRWGAAALVIALLAAGLVRMLAARKAQQGVQATLPQATQPSTVELAASDVFLLQPQTLTRSLPVSGTVRALQAAFVKARVAGELLDLQVREGDPVRAGQLVARIEPSEFDARLRQAQLQADAARAQVDIAQRQFDNNQALVNQGFISKTALDTSLASLQGAQATFRAAEAAVDVARKSLVDTRLLAPLNGQVAQRLAQPGERVAVDARILEIVDLTRLEVEAALSPMDAGEVRIGQSAQLTVEGSTSPITARVTRINPSTQAGSRSVLVYLSLDRTDGLRQGLFAQGALGTTQRTVLAVPEDAVRNDKPQPYLQVVENAQVVHRSVSLGETGVASTPQGTQRLQAISGVASNTLVLAASAGSLREGTRVRFTSPPAVPASAPAPAPAAPTPAAR